MEGLGAIFSWAALSFGMALFGILLYQLVQGTLLGEFLLRPAPASLSVNVFENIGIWFATYALLYCFFDVLGPHTQAIRKWKHEPTYTDRAMVVIEIQRSFVCVLICCAIEIGVEFLNPWVDSVSLTDLTSLQLGAIILGLIIWGDLHFWSQHRLMHTDYLYRHIHKIHHQSRNPNVFSGLSFHPVEGVFYFSMLLLPFVVPTPYWAWWHLKIGAIMAPAGGHSGHGTSQTDWHYLHHKTTHFNFGLTRLIDCVAGFDWRVQHAAKMKAK